MADQLFLDEATKCLPTFTCDTEYYQALCKHSPTIELRVHPIAGKSLIAKCDIKEDEHVLVETALVVSQNLDDWNNEVMACCACLASLESPKEIVRRVTDSAELAKLIPKKVAGFTPPAPIACTHESIGPGCTAAFCDERCRDEAIRTHHYVGCQGRMSAESAKAFQELREGDWVHNGVDLSDTVFIAFRFVCFVLTRHRLHRMPLPMAFFPVSQLIKAPISDFHFTYLVNDEFEEEEDKAIKAARKAKARVGVDGDNKSTAAAAAAAVHPAVGNRTGDETLNSELSDDQRMRKRWRAFLEYKENPRRNPVVQMQLSAEDPDKVEFVRKANRLVHLTVDASPQEAAFLTDELWSNLLGAILLNGQERAPNSCFGAFLKAWRSTPEGSEEAKKFVKALKAAQIDGVDIKSFDTSAQGQGVYGALGCCFNHSCAPNVQVHYGGRDDEMICVVALRNIAKGEELCISYIDETMPLQKRQQQLFEHYLFTCACSKCTVETAQLKKGIAPGAGASKDASRDASQDNDAATD